MALPEFMNVGRLTAKKYPEAVLPHDVQVDIVEHIVDRLLASGPPFGPEQAAHFWRSFEEGRRVYADPRKLATALKEAGPAGHINLAQDLDNALEIDRGNAAKVVFVRVKGRGYVLARPADVDAIWAAILRND